MNKIVIGDAFDLSLPHNQGLVNAPLVILDPPYGRILKDKWDQLDQYNEWFKLAKECTTENAVIAIWGGIGKHKDRPFLKFLAEAECNEWAMLNLITWSKKRAYGKKNNYLFTREECAIFVKGNPVFNIPLLSEKRGYEGYNKKYPALSEYKRRTNVWTDINELFRGKVHPAQKPVELYKVLIETHSKPNDLVVDLCAGSGVTAKAAIACGRNYYCVEKEAEYISGEF